MKKRNLLNRPTRVNDMQFDDLYDEISADLDLKIERLQTRRWRKMQREMA